MQSMLKLTESDPHDVFAVAPGIVPAAWADRVLADITRDAGSVPQVKPVHAESSATGAPAPNVDMTFRSTAAADSRIPDIDVANDRPALPRGGSRTKSTIIAFLFALCSAIIAAGWQHYGVAARQMIAAWTPPFALTALQSTEPTGLPGRADTPAVEVPLPATAQASAEDQAAPAPAQAPEGTAPAVAPSPDAAQLRSMARDLAAMGQEVELLKATVAELRASQQPVAGDAGRASQAKTSELKPSIQTPRPKVSVPPLPRAAAAAPRRPAQAYPVQTYPVAAYPAQAYPPAQAAPPPLQQFPPPTSLQSAPPAADQDGDPVIRPPMPLH
jgi:hypothetical protein